MNGATIPACRMSDLQTSTAPNSMEDEWSSEAVQLGGVGSAMGSLGMWTGALHEEDDPLGQIFMFDSRNILIPAHSPELYRHLLAVARPMS